MCCTVIVVTKTFGVLPDEFVRYYKYTILTATKLELKCSSLKVTPLTSILFVIYFDLLRTLPIRPIRFIFN